MLFTINFFTSVFRRHDVNKLVLLYDIIIVYSEICGVYTFDTFNKGNNLYHRLCEMNFLVCLGVCVKMVCE